MWSLTDIGLVLAIASILQRRKLQWESLSAFLYVSLRSQVFSQRVAPSALMVNFNCPEKDSLRDSNAIKGTEKQSQKGQASPSADSRKWDSTAASDCQPEAATTRVSDYQGSRAADGR